MANIIIDFDFTVQFNVSITDWIINMICWLYSIKCCIIACASIKWWSHENVSINYFVWIEKLSHNHNEEVNSKNFSFLWFHFNWVHFKLINLHMHSMHTIFHIYVIYWLVATGLKISFTFSTFMLLLQNLSSK